MDICVLLKIKLVLWCWCHWYIISKTQDIDGRWIHYMHVLSLQKFDNGKSHGKLLEVLRSLFSSDRINLRTPDSRCLKRTYRHAARHRLARSFGNFQLFMGHQTSSGLDPAIRRPVHADWTLRMSPSGSSIGLADGLRRKFSGLWYAQTEAYSRICIALASYRPIEIGSKPSAPKPAEWKT